MLVKQFRTHSFYALWPCPDEKNTGLFQLHTITIAFFLQHKTWLIHPYSKCTGNLELRKSKQLLNLDWAAEWGWIIYPKRNKGNSLLVREKGAWGEEVRPDCKISVLWHLEPPLFYLVHFFLVAMHFNSPPFVPKN